MKGMLIDWIKRAGNYAGVQSVIHVYDAALAQSVAVLLLLYIPILWHECEREKSRYRFL